jgi:hypothetical protein
LPRPQSPSSPSPLQVPNDSTKTLLEISPRCDFRQQNTAFDRITAAKSTAIQTVKEGLACRMHPKVRASRPANKPRRLSRSTAANPCFRLLSSSFAKHRTAATSGSMNFAACGCLACACRGHRVGVGAAAHLSTLRHGVKGEHRRRQAFKHGRCRGGKDLKSVIARQHFTDTPPSWKPSHSSDARRHQGLFNAEGLEGGGLIGAVCLSLCYKRPCHIFAVGCAPNVPGSTIPHDSAFAILHHQPLLAARRAGAVPYRN